MTIGKYFIKMQVIEMFSVSNRKRCAVSVLYIYSKNLTTIMICYFFKYSVHHLLDFILLLFSVLSLPSLYFYPHPATNKSAFHLFPMNRYLFAYNLIQQTITHFGLLSYTIIRILVKKNFTFTSITPLSSMM